jgi:hypothetical protein
MFTWICPQCGREVPPAYAECPDCGPKNAAGPPPPAATAGNPAGPAAPPQQSLEPAQPPAFAPPQEAPPAVRRPRPSSPMFQESPPPPPQYAPPRRGGMQVPTWLMALLFALVILGIGGGILWYASSQRSQTPTAIVESPAAKPGAAQNPLQKYIEVTGLRFGKSAKGVVVTFILVNHSDSDLVGLAGNATIWGRTRKSEEDAIGTFAFETSMAAQSSKELTLPFTTKLKMIEMPDWQNATVDVQITAPPGA